MHTTGKFTQNFISSLNHHLLRVLSFIIPHGFPHTSFAVYVSPSLLPSFSFLLFLQSSPPPFLLLLLLPPPAPPLLHLLLLLLPSSPPPPSPPPPPCHFFQGSTELTARALPEIAKLLQPQNGGDTSAVSEAAKLLHDLTKKETSYKAVLSNAHVVRTMVQGMVSTRSLDVQKSLAGCIHNMSGDRSAHHS